MSYTEFCLCVCALQDQYNSVSYYIFVLTNEPSEKNTAFSKPLKTLLIQTYLVNLFNCFFWQMKHAYSMLTLSTPPNSSLLYCHCRPKYFL